jgi:hypothetical protein
MSRRAQQQAEKERRESVCAAIVCDVIGNGARWRRRDVPGGPPGLHDFDIEFPDGDVEALEVCAFTEGAAEAQRDALEMGDALDSQRLITRWSLSVPHVGVSVREARARRLLPALEAQLEVLEGHHEYLFVDGNHYVLLAQLGPTHPVVQASKALIEMGVRDGSGRPLGPGEAPGLDLRTSAGGVVDPESVNRAVEDRAGEAGNVRKLSAATHATSRHIFVPIYFGAPLTFAAVHHMSLTSTPTLPSVVTRAWVLGGANGVVFVEPPATWQRVSFNSLAASNPANWEA